MTITSITEVKNNTVPISTVIKERMDKFIPNINVKNIPNRNGFIYALVGSGGSGKTNLLLNFFKSKKMYRNKFSNIFYFCPASSFASIDKHPFQKHDKVYHTLSSDALQEVYDKLCEIKEDKENKTIEYNCLIIDDFADALKSNDIAIMLNKILIKARHLSCAIILTLQSYFYLSRMIRKQLTNITIFKPKSLIEWETLSKKLFNVNKDDALTIFNYVFDEPYNHLDVNTVDNTYFKNWNLLEFIRIY